MKSKATSFAAAVKAAAAGAVSFVAAAVMSLSVCAANTPEIPSEEPIVTSIVTEVPNVETSVPETTQTQVEPFPQTEQTVTETPYDTPVTDGEDEESLLERIGITGTNDTIDLMLLITVLSLAPSIIIMFTCFTRIIISFSLLRNAMGIQQTPPNQVLIGLALFLTLFIMTPVVDEIDRVAYAPYKNGDITMTEALKEAEVPLKKWMLANTSNDSMSFFIDLTGGEYPQTDEEAIENLDFRTVVPAFILSEIKKGFEIGFLLYIPFLIIDIVVSSTLMSLGMIMLPPATIAMPFKILLFVMVDGWTLLVGSLISGFNPVTFT